MCGMSWCDLDLTFDLAVATLNLKILSGLYVGNVICRTKYLVGTLVRGYWFATSWCDLD